MLPIQRSPNSKLRYRTTIGKLHRKQTTSHTHVLSRRRQTFLGADLLEGGGSVSSRLVGGAVAVPGFAMAC
jgi:hypothetical protein